MRRMMVTCRKTKLRRRVRRSLWHRRLSCGLRDFWSYAQPRLLKGFRLAAELYGIWCFLSSIASWL